jgi:hypothetical protein
MAGRGQSTLLAGGAAAVALPVLALGAHLPLLLAAPIAAAVFAGVWLLAPGPTARTLDVDALTETQDGTARALITDAQGALARLQAAGRSVKDAQMKAGLDSLQATASRVLQDLRGHPEHAMAVRRLLTFYLPNAASLAEGWRALEATTKPAPERVAQTRSTVAALDDAFTRFADDLQAPQLQTLDLDLRVLNDALKSDLEKT